MNFRALVSVDARVICEAEEKCESIHERKQTMAQHDKILHTKLGGYGNSDSNCSDRLRQTGAMAVCEGSQAAVGAQIEREVEWENCVRKSNEGGERLTR